MATGIGELQRVSQGLLEVLSFKERPRGEIGRTTSQVRPWQVVSHRSELEWRGAGIGFRSDSWCLLKKRQGSRGVWAKLRRLRDGAELWCGSVYLSQGACREVHAQKIHDFMGVAPATLLPVLVGGDAHTLIKWTAQAGERAVAIGPEAKGDYMLGVMQGEGFVLTPPKNSGRLLPVSLEGKIRVLGRLTLWHAGVQSAITAGSTWTHTSTWGATMKGLHRWFPLGWGHRDGFFDEREVVREPVIEGELDRNQLESIARKRTRPRQGQAHRDPQHVKVMFQIARRNHSSEDWKCGWRKRSKRRRKGDWGAYQETTKKGSAGWESHFARAMPENVDPHKAVHDHLQGVYGGGASSVPEFPFVKVDRVPDFTPEELCDALQKGKTKKSVGSDQVPHELLKTIGATPEGQHKILTWFNRLLHGEEALPTELSRASMILIPKVTLPTEPRQVRPICIGQAANKLFCRMLLECTKQALRYSGSSQSMGAGRQTNDYVFSITRLMQLEREWKWGLCFLKIDVEKAFDSLNRKRFLEQLSTKLGANEVLKCWWHMFQHTDAVLQTVWGESVVNMTTGIRQGSVESPQMFAAVIDWILTDFQDDIVTVGEIDGLNLSEIAFVDDIIAWNRSRQGLSARVGVLVEELGRSGLKVNANKSQVYVSPFNKDQGHVTVNGVAVPSDDHMKVMGIHLKTGVTAREALAPLFVKSRYWATKHIYRAKVPLEGRLKLMNRTLGNQALWCAAAFFPDKQALQTVNVLQSQLVIWSMRLSKPSAPRGGQSIDLWDSVGLLGGLPGLGTMRDIDRDVVDGNLLPHVLYSTTFGPWSGGRESKERRRVPDIPQDSFRN